MVSLFGSIITPAIVASLFTLLFNARAAKRKDHRDAYTKRVEESRTLVSTAVKAAADYFSKDAKGRDAALEAALWMSEREVRISLSALIEKSYQEIPTELANLRDDFDRFVAELTSGNFGQNSAVADIPHVRKIASLGAELRQSIMIANEAELNLRLDKDPLTIAMKYLELGNYYKRKLPTD